MVNYLDDRNLVFDRTAVRHHRARALGNHDNPLFSEVAERLADRLLDVRRHFALALDLGTRDGHCVKAITATGRVERLVLCDSSAKGLNTAIGTGLPTVAAVADEEMLPFATESLELVTSSLALHWANDLPGVLAQLRRALKPDGLILAALFAGNTLSELRAVLTEAEAAERGGASPHVSPFVDGAEASSLLQRAGFALPVVDVDTLRLTYTDAFALMHDLRAMGETNALRLRDRSFSRRDVFLRAADLYSQRFGLPDGRIPATFQIAFLTGWSPAVDQRQPLRPGSAVARLADALGTEELSSGEKAGDSENE